MSSCVFPRPGIGSAPTMLRLTVIAVTGLATLTLAACSPQQPDVTEGDQVPTDEGDELPAEDDSDNQQAANGPVDGTFVAVDIDWGEAPDSLPVGEVTLELVNDGNIVHDLVVGELGDEVIVDRTNGGQTATGAVQLDPGEYTFYCSVPGHRAAGMEAAVTVE